MPPKALIFGGGSIGAISTYLLSKSLPPSHLVALCRSNQRVAAEQGFNINSKVWGPNLNVRPTVVQSMDEAIQKTPGGFDYILLTTKALSATTQFPKSIKPLVSPHTAIVLMQNGISIEEPYSTVFPNNPILSAAIYITCTQTKPAIYDHVVLKNIHLGTYPATAPKAHKDSADQLVDMLNHGGADATHEPDIQVERWRKLLINASDNPICALGRLRDATFLTIPGAVSFMRDVMVEIASVARSFGYQVVDEEMVDQQMALLTSREMPGVEPSMMADAMAERQMEVECILGNTVRIAHEHGVKVPRLETLYYLASAVNRSFQSNQ